MKRIIALVCSGLLVTGCARDISSNSYSEDEVNYASEVHDGVIVSSRVVSVSDQNEIAGAIAGGVLGAAAGSAIGGGRASTVMAAVGAVGGAAAGREAQKHLSKQKAIEYIVKVNGKQMKIVQGGPRNRVGDHVKVSLGGGRPRII